MFLFKRDGHAIVNAGQTFRQFWKSGFQGHLPTHEDWKVHLNTLFPEVRLKRTIEIRGADTQATNMACALPALWTGVFYDERALSEAEALVEGWSFDEVDALRNRGWHDGLRAPFRGKPLAEVAQRLVAIADGGLERRRRLSKAGEDERVHLRRLRRLANEACAPADALLEGIDREPDLSRAIVERAALTWS
jgi:glutamate--cysteine ligase